MRIDCYVLCLLKLLDDNTVFSEADLNRINSTIGETLEADYEEKDAWKVYPIEKNFNDYLQSLSRESNEVSSKVPEFILRDASLGYYHHRFIVTFEIDISPNDFSQLRSIRKILTSFTNTLLQKIIVKNEDTLKFFYSYPLLLIYGNNQVSKKSKKLLGQKPLGQNANIFTDETTTLAFEILEPKWWSPLGITHRIRISIPGVMIYSKREIGYALLRDMINAIYQHALYQKKLLDTQSDAYKNELTEPCLVSLWEHILDTMGGRTSDKFMAKVTQTNYFIALLALIIAIISADWLTEFCGQIFSFLSHM